MNEFLMALDRALHSLVKEEREEILADYREHFEIGLSQGKTEGQIMRELGDPDTIAKLYTAMKTDDRGERPSGPAPSVRQTGKEQIRRVCRVWAVRTVYLPLTLCMIPLFALGAGLILGAVGAICITAVEFTKSFIVSGVAGVFISLTLLALGALTLIGAKALWKGATALLPKWIQRRAGQEERKEKEE